MGGKASDSVCVLPSGTNHRLEITCGLEGIFGPAYLGMDMVHGNPFHSMSPPLELLRHAAHPIRVHLLRLKFFWVLSKTVFANIFPEQKRNWAAHPSSIPSPARLARDSFISHIAPIPFSWYKLWAGNLRQTHLQECVKKEGFVEDGEKSLSYPSICIILFLNDFRPFAYSPTHPQVHNCTMYME